MDYYVYALVEGEYDDAPITGGCYDDKEAAEQALKEHPNLRIKTIKVTSTPT